MEKIRLGIIGIGNMGKGHIQNVIDGRCPSVEITAVCDIDQKQLDYASEKLNGVATYTDAIEFSLLIIILLVKPNGFLGKKRREKV